MAASSSSSSSTIFTASGVPQPPVTVSQEEFILFHNIDRKLFSRLVFALGRDPGESAQVVALFMWLEHAGDELNLVHRICSSLPDTLLNGIADESVVALNCIQSDDFYDSSSSATSIARDIPLIQALTKNGHNLKYFHQNRLGIIRGVSKLLNEVCMRAFDDLMPKLNPLLNYPYNNPYFQTPAAAATYEIATGAANLGPPPPPAALYPTQTQRMYVAAENPYNQFSGSRQMLMAYASARAPDASLDYLRSVFDHPCDLAAQRHAMNSEMNEMLARLNLNMDDDDQFVVDSADERTIFLTFSKGYPISETEVREFFSRKFGEFIEDVFMQDVPPEEQPLYARLVVRNAAIIPAVLDGQSKAKFSINGKHVWARKYVRKNQKSPSRSPGEPSSPRAGFAPTQF